jgi:hypothetical protein
MVRTPATSPAQGGPAKKQKTDHAIVDIVPQPIGDIVIRVGSADEVGPVRVSKTFMLVASPFLRTMLAGGFSEALKTFDEKDLLVLEDNRWTFITLCKLLHHQAVEEVKKISVDQVVAVAILVDKYGCSGTIIQPLLTTLRLGVDVARLSEDSKLPWAVKDLLNMAVLAYFAKDEGLLW